MNAMEIEILKKKRLSPHTGMGIPDTGDDIDDSVLQELQDKMHGMALKPALSIKIEGRKPDDFNKLDKLEELESPDEEAGETPDEESAELEESPAERIKRLEDELKLLKMGRHPSVARY